MADDKIALLMEETGCDEEQARLALEESGYQLAEAVKTVARALRHIVVLKGKFANPGGDQFGLFMAVLNVKTGAVLRVPAVVSFNPAVYTAALDAHWFDFEKHLYGCRLWDGSLQTESLEIERALADHFRAASGADLADLGRDDGADPTGEIAVLLRRLFKAERVSLKVQKDVLDLGQFQSLSSSPERPRGKSRSSAKTEELLVLKVALEEDRAGVSAREVRAGDMVSALIVDSRDIGQYLARLFGGLSDEGPVPVLAPVEAVESGPDGVLVRVRFSVGVCGDAAAAEGSRVKIVRIAVRNQESHSWWRRFFKT